MRSAAVAEALQRANAEVAEGRGAVVDFLSKGWRHVTKGDTDGIFVVDIVLAEELEGGSVSDQSSEVHYLEYELPVFLVRGNAQPTKVTKPIPSSGSPYLSAVGRSRGRRSSSGELAPKPSGSGPKAATDEAAAPTPPQTEHVTALREALENRHTTPSPKVGSGGHSYLTQRQPPSSARVPTKPTPQKSPRPNKQHPKVSPRDDERVVGRSEQVDEFTQDESGAWENPTESSRQERPWNDKSASDWFKEKQQKAANCKTNEKLREHEQILKDLSYIRRRKAAQADRAHAMKLNDPRYAYHIRRWTAASRIQRAARAHYALWSITKAWRAKVNLHPEMRRKMFLDHIYNSRWDKHIVPQHLLESWRVAGEFESDSATCSSSDTREGVK